jgi:GntR family transcriptional repressor for pyruvate dehydrogenase complex
MQAPSRSAAIAAQLRDQILRGQYRCGERLPSERDLAVRFEVHRSAVREALKRLEQLGLAQIRPGGARVAPVEEASLDVVEHLLDLEDPPDPAMVDQVLEVMAGLFGMAARLCAERASVEQRAAILDLLNHIATEDANPYERMQLIHQLGDRFVEASGNLVLTLVRRGVRTRFIERFEALRPANLPPLPLQDSLLKSIALSIEERDGAGAAEAVHELSLALRRHALETVAIARASQPTQRKTS